MDRFLSSSFEGVQVCEYLQAIGVTAVLLRYRTPTADEEQPQAYPLQDLQRAMGIVRHRTQLPPPLLLPNQSSVKEPHCCLVCVQVLPNGPSIRAGSGCWGSPLAVILSVTRPGAVSLGHTHRSKASMIRVALTS